LKRKSILVGLSLWLLPLLFLAFFFFYPLLAVLGLTGEPVPGGGSADWGKVWEPLRFTFWQAFLSTVLTMGIGLPAAYLFVHFTFPGKRLLRVLITLPFILPTVVVAAGFNALIGPRGWLNLALMGVFQLEAPPVNLLNTLTIIVLAHAFYNTSIVIRLVGSAWAQLDPRLEQAARTLGAPPLRAFREVTVPLLRPAIFAAALLVFLFDFTSFGVILLLGGPHFATLEVEIYIQALQLLNLPQAALLSAVQLAATLALTLLYQRAARGRDVPLTPQMNGAGLTVARGWQRRAFVGGMVVILVTLLVLPLLALATRSITRLDAARGERGSIQAGVTLDYYQELFINRRGSLFYVPPLDAMKNSLLYAGATVLFSLGLGILAAYALHYRSRINLLLDPLLMLPLGASAVTLGLGFVIVFSTPPLDPRSFPLLIPIAHSLVALPFVIRTLQPALASIPTHLRQAAAVLGASPWQVWWEVDRPILARAALVSATFAFTISLGEFGATSFLARPEAPTLPVAIFRFLSQPGALNYGQALAMATLLMLICGLAIAIMEKVGHSDPHSPA
jgi:thiamine transport system permease protein